MALELTSPAFKNNGFIPKQYTCDGENISPPLNWNHIPTETKSFVLIADDPDAPMGTWVHWILFNIPSEVSHLPENSNQLPSQTMQGNTSWNKTGYGGPCPPSGTHRYFFKLYALDSLLPLLNGATQAEIMKAMEDHVLDKTSLMGRYQRK